MKDKNGMAIIIGVGKGGEKGMGGKCKKCEGEGCPECENEMESEYASSAEGDVEFNAPEGMDYSGLKYGDEKEVIAKIRYDGDGKFYLKEVDGYSLSSKSEEEMPESSEEDMAQEKPEEGYASKLSNRAKQMGMI
jgi:hypothetical protein